MISFYAHCLPCQVRMTVVVKVGCRQLADRLLGESCVFIKHITRATTIPRSRFGPQMLLIAQV